MRNTFKDMEPEALEDMLSNFLLSSWSYSKLVSFACNEKAFEMNYIYGVYSKKSATSIAGQAYHKALEYYFAQMKEGVKIDIVELETAAFMAIDEVPANQWKLQKTTPTIEESQKKAYATVSALLKNFVSEVDIYENEIAEVLDVEIYGDEFVCVNGVEIPLPLHFKIDLVVRTKEGKTAVVDHKSKTAYTGEDELAMGIGVQAVSYVIGYEEKRKVKVDEVWFVENKYSNNKDGKPQLNKYKVIIDADTRSLYEALLYEPLKRVISAVRDPDYVYLINPYDNLSDLAEIHAFWSRTQLAEIGVEDFNIEEGKKELVSKRLKKIRDASIKTVSPTILKNFRENAATFIQYDLSNKNMTQEQKIEHALKPYGISVRVAHKKEGYSSNTLLLEVSAGVKIASIHSRRLDIANALDVENVRISKTLVMFEKKSYLGVEISKAREGILYFDPAELQDGKIPVGKNNFGETVYWNPNNPSTPHMLVCGGTGSGKTAYLTTIIESLKLSGYEDIIIFDSKFTFNKIYFRGSGVVLVNEIIDIENQMQKLVDYMNNLVRDGKEKKTAIIFDEFADAIDNSRKKDALKIYEMQADGYYANGNLKTKRVCSGELNSLATNLKILAQKSRQCGFRIITATQRASVDVINGDTKVNFPVQVCFKVQKRVDSIVVLDEEGAEILTGNGDGLFKSCDYPETVRFQAFYKPAHSSQAVA